MGPESIAVPASSFSERLPPQFDGHSSYSVYRQDVELWLVLTSLDKCKQGPALIGSLSGEAKASAKTLGLSVISSDDGATKILEHLDKSYGVDKVDQLDIDLASFLDFNWTGNMAVEQFIAGFHSRIDKIAELHMDDKLKGHLLLRAAGLDSHMRNLIVGTSAGNYDVSSISSALRQAFRNNFKPASMASHFEDTPSKVSHKTSSRSKGMRTTSSISTPLQNQKSLPKSDPAIFTTFAKIENLATFASAISVIQRGALLDSGACSSVVGKKTLDDVMKMLQLKNIRDAKPKITSHRFGTHEEVHTTLFAVLFPFEMQTSKGDTVSYMIHFDVIEGSLPFLIGLPSLRAMRANLNCEFLSLGFKIRGSYQRVKLFMDNNHLYLPFRARQHTYQSYYKTLPVTEPQQQKLYSPASISSDGATIDGLYTPSSDNTMHATSSRSEPTSSKLKKKLDPSLLKKLHLQLKHGSYSAMVDWIRSAGMWEPELEENIKSLLAECACATAREPLPHPVASISLPEKEAQVSLCLDDVYFEGIPCLHVMDKCTQWSETSVLRTRKLSFQAAEFIRIQIYRHGVPHKITGDNEFNKGDFLAMCNDFGIVFSSIAANDHEANGLIERGNRTLRSFFRRIRADKPKLNVSEVLAEATFGKNLCKGDKLASSFELLYGRKPRIMGEIELLSNSPVSIWEHVQDVSKRRINSMLRKNIRYTQKISPGDFVYFWRDGKRWVGPGQVIRVEGNIVTLTHDERTKTSSLNRVRKTEPPLELLDEIELREAASTVLNPPYAISEETPRNSDEKASAQQSGKEATISIRGRPKGSKSFAPELSSSGEWTRHPKVTRDAPIVTRSRSKKSDMQDVNTKRGTNVTEDGSIRNHPLSLASIIRCLSECDDPEMKYLPYPSDNTASYLTGTGTFLIEQKITQEEMAEAYAAERKKWKDANAMEIFKSSDVPIDSNIIGSHTRFTRKSNGEVKARICPWGNHDIEKLNLRSDCPSILMEILRLVLSISVEMGWEIGSMDAVAAYLQALGFAREIFVRPPSEELAENVLWRLKAAAYGLVDSGRLWYLTSNVALCQSFGLNKSKYEPTLYFSKNRNGHLELLVLVQVDNYIYTGKKDHMKKFEEFLSSHFKIGSLERNKFLTYGCEIEQSNNMSITLTQKSKLDDIMKVDIRPINSYQRSGNDVASPQELKHYRSLLGKVLFLGRMSQPIMLRISSEMGTKTNHLLVHHLKDLHAQVKYALGISHCITYERGSSIGTFSLDIYSDATCPKDHDQSREGYIIFRRCNDVTHPIFWMSRKLQRVARSSSTAEILGAADSVDKALYLAAVLSEVHYSHSVDLTTDSKSLFSLATAISEPEESMNKVDLAAIRSSYESGAIRRIFWSPGYYLIADALTKNNRETCALLAKVMKEGKYPLHCDAVYRTSPKGEVKI